MSSDFNPEKFKALNASLLKLYIETGNASLLLERYLSLVTKGMFVSDNNGKFVGKDFTQHKAFCGSSIKSKLKACSK